jgi:hypothetical protein
MTKKELELKLDRYKKRLKYHNLIDFEVINTLQKILNLCKDSDTEESKKVNYIIGVFLDSKDSIKREFEEGTGKFSIN